MKTDEKTGRLSKSYLGPDGEIRELDAQFFREARRGRPPLPPAERKKRVSMLLDPDVIAHFKLGGRGWQTRVNAALREVAGL